MRLFFTNVAADINLSHHLWLPLLSASTPLPPPQLPSPLLPPSLLFTFRCFSIPLSFHFSFHLLPLNYPRLCDLYIVLRKLLTRMLPFTQSPLPFPLSLYLFISYFLGHPYFNKYCNTWMYQHCVCSFSFHRNQLWSAQARILLLLLLLYLFNIYGNLSNAKTKHVKHPRFVRKMTDILW